MISEEEPEGATPLSGEERDELIPGHIETRGELNEWEQVNIHKAESKVFRRTRRETVLTAQYAKELHLEMFDETWSWAGKFRNTAKTIGVPQYEIQSALDNLLEDTKYKITHRVCEVDELAARFHHRLVQIHLFPNGNGRHARLLTDLLLWELGGERFSWGKRNLTIAGEARVRYIEALRKADKHEFGPLFRFVRS